MRAYTPGGRFDADFELDLISEGITADLTNPAGSIAQWWRFDPVHSVSDPTYDVEPVGAGRVWIGPLTLPVIRASITQGTSTVNDRGFYNADVLHVTLNIDDLYAVSPELFSDKGIVKPNIDVADKYRMVWKDQVYRPNKTQQTGVFSERHTLITLDMFQLMGDELVNDVQFLRYAQP